MNTKPLRSAERRLLSQKVAQAVDDLRRERDQLDQLFIDDPELISAVFTGLDGDYAFIKQTLDESPPEFTVLVARLARMAIIVGLLG